MTEQTAPAAPVAPKAVTPTATAPALPGQSETAVDVKAELAKVEAGRRDIEKKERQHVIERRKFSAEREQEKKTWGEKLSEYEQFKKVKSQARLNPEAFFKEAIGDDWYDVAVGTKINAGAPTAGSVADEIRKVEEKLEAKFAAKEAERAKVEAKQREQNVASAKRQLANEALDFWKANAKEYPAFRGSDEQIAQMLSARIEQEYYNTERRDPDTNELLMSGRVLTMKEMADKVESEIIAHAEIVAGAEKYREKLRLKLTPAAPTGSIGGPKLQRTENHQRRTLSNDLTGSTPGRQPAVTQEEKRQRAIARFNELHNKAAT